MKVLLVQDVRGVGRKDEIVTVSDGYGKNFLLKKGFAIPAHGGVVAKVKKLQANKKQAQDEHRVKMQLVYQQLDGSSLEVFVKAIPEGHLFGSFQPGDVVKEIERMFGVSIDKSMLQMSSIKKVGTYQITIKLLPDIVAKVSLHVTKDE